VPAWELPVHRLYCSPALSTTYPRFPSIPGESTRQKLDKGQAECF
jgi:hypothetical protein